MKIEAWWEREWEDNGITWVALVRERDNGWCDVAVFLIDVWCLGVKDCYLDSMPRGDFDDLLAKQIPEATRETIEPACARRFIDGALAYAEKLGFLPHRDFKKVRKIFGSTKAAECERSFTFGREGRPCFVAGDADDDARIRRVLAVLEARVGPDGFDTELPGQEEEEVAQLEEATDFLYKFIEEGRCPDKTFTAWEVDGFSIGIALLPELPGQEFWEPAVWGGAERKPVVSETEGLKLEAAIIACLVLARMDLGRGYFSPALSPRDEADHVVGACGYARGLLCGLELDATVAAWFRAHPDADADLAWLARLAAAGASDDPALCAELQAMENLDEHLGRIIERLARLGSELVSKPS